MANELIVPEPSQYLIKRNPDFTRYGVIVKRKQPRKWYSETKIAKSKVKPPSISLNLGDTVYVAETGYGVYARGEVVKIGKLHTFRTINSIFDFINESKIKDSSFWMDRIQKFRKKKKEDKSYVLRYHEYAINQKLLDHTIPLPYSLRTRQGGFIAVKPKEIKALSNPKSQTVTELHSKIPSALRMNLYSLFQRKSKVSHWIDIDHFVPKNLGGPGNIKENLVPIGLSLNRYKSDSVPSGLFAIAKQYETLSPMIAGAGDFEEKDFLKDNSSKERARKIIDVVNKGDIQEAREFYSKVLKHHYSQYWEIINEFE